MGVGRSRDHQSSNQQRSGMSGEDDDNRLPPIEPNREQPSRGRDRDTEDQLSIARVLRHLINSGQVRLLTSDNTYVGSGDDSDGMSSEDSVELELNEPSLDSSSMGATASSASSIPKRDKNEIQKSEIQVHVALRSGCTSRWPHTVTRSIPKRICQRQYGMVGCNRSGTFTSSDRCNVSNQFMPNKRRLLASHQTKTFCCHYTNGGNTMLTASQDHCIRMYERKGSRRKYVQLKSIRAPYVGWSILDLAVSPDGRHCIYATWSEYIHQCRLDGDEADWKAFNLEPTDHRFCVFSLRFSENGNQVLAGASDGQLYVYDREEEFCLLKIGAHEDDVNAVCFGDQTSNIIYSGADDGLCKVWDRRTLSEAHPIPVGVMAGHCDGITYIDSKADGRFLITNSKDQSIKLWDVRKFSSKQAMEATKQAVKHQDWDYRWQSVPRNAKKYRRLDGDTSVMTYRGHTVLHTLVRSYFSPLDVTGQKYIYSGCARGSCIIYDLLTGDIVSRMEGHRSCVRDVAWHPFENEICTAGWDGHTAVWRYDERYSRDTNPETPLSNGPKGDEDTSDEDSCIRSLKRRKRQGRTIREGSRFVRISALLTGGDASSDEEEEGTRRRNVNSRRRQDSS